MGVVGVGNLSEAFAHQTQTGKHPLCWFLGLGDKPTCKKQETALGPAGLWKMESTSDGISGVQQVRNIPEAASGCNQPTSHPATKPRRIQPWHHRSVVERPTSKRQRGDSLGSDKIDSTDETCGPWDGDISTKLWAQFILKETSTKRPNPSKKALPSFHGPHLIIGWKSFPPPALGQPSPAPSGT